MIVKIRPTITVIDIEFTTDGTTGVTVARQGEYMKTLRRLKEEHSGININRIELHQSTINYWRPNR